MDHAALGKQYLYASRSHFFLVGTNDSMQWRLLKLSRGCRDQVHADIGDHPPSATSGNAPLRRDELSPLNIALQSGPQPADADSLEVHETACLSRDDLVSLLKTVNDVNKAHGGCQLVCKVRAFHDLRPPCPSAWRVPRDV